MSQPLLWLIKKIKNISLTAETIGDE